MKATRNAIGFDRIVGVDPSLNGTGLAYGDGGGISTKRITPGKLRGMPRIERIRRKLARLCTPTTLVVIEGFSFGARGRAVFDLGQLGGILRWWLWKHHITYAEVPPMSLKKFVTGKGNAKKEHVLMHVYKRWKYEAPNSDEADAYGLYKIGEALIAREKGCEGKLPAYASAALEKLRLPGGSDG